MRNALRSGLFIGVTTSSLVLVIVRYLPPNKIVFIVMLYLYAVVGVATAFIVYRDHVTRPKEELFKKSRLTEEIRNNQKFALCHLRNYERSHKMWSDCNFLLDFYFDKLNSKMLDMEDKIKSSMD